MYKQMTLALLALGAVAPPLHADELQRQRLRDLGDRLVFVVEGGNHPDPQHKGTDRFDAENAEAKASALAGITYTNRVVESDLLTMDNRRFQVDLNNIGRSLYAGHDMLAGPHGKVAERIPLAIPEGTSDRCIGPCLAAFRYCTNQPGAAAINRYMTHRERMCLYWFFRRDLNVAIQDAIQSLQPAVGGVAAAAPALPALGPPPLPVGAVRAFTPFGNAMLPGHNLPVAGGAPVAVGVAGDAWVAGGGLPGPGAPAPVPAALRAKRNSAPILVIALGTPTSFYSHNPKKYIGYHYDAKRPPVPLANQPLMQALVAPQPPGGGIPLPATGALPGGPNPVTIGGAWAIAPPPAGHICADYIRPPAGGVIGPVWPAPGGIWPGLPGLPGAPANPGNYKLNTLPGGPEGCSDFDLKIYSPDLTHLYIQEVMRLRNDHSYEQYYRNGVYLLPATAPLVGPAPVIPVGNPRPGLPNRIRMVETWDWLAMPLRAAAIGVFLGAPPIPLPGAFGAAIGAAAVAGALDKGEFETLMKPLLPFNTAIVDDGKVHVFKNTVSWAAANIPVPGGAAVPATAGAGTTGIGLYEVFPALARFAFDWTLALGREVDLKLEFTYDQGDYGNAPGGPIAVLNEDAGEDTPEYVRLWPTPCHPGGC